MTLVCYHAFEPTSSRIGRVIGLVDILLRLTSLYSALELEGRWANMSSRVTQLCKLMTLIRFELKIVNIENYLGSLEALFIEVLFFEIHSVLGALREDKEISGSIRS